MSDNNEMRKCNDYVLMNINDMKMIMFYNEWKYQRKNSNDEYMKNIGENLKANENDGGWANESGETAWRIMKIYNEENNNNEMKYINN